MNCVATMRRVRQRVSGVAEPGAQLGLVQIMFRPGRDTFYAICPPLYRFSDRDRSPCGLDKLQQALAWQYGERGLLLHGPTGNGKTRVAWLLLRRLHFAGHGIIAFDAVSYSHPVARHFGPNGDGYGWARKIYTAPIVFLDDVGKCRLTERGEAELFGLVEHAPPTANPSSPRRTLSATHSPTP